MKGFTLQRSPFVVPTQDGKYIGEHWGLATDGNSKISIAHMKAPAGWSEPFQTPEFEEYTLVISGSKQVEIEGETIILTAGESLKVEKNTRVRYSNPFTEPCEYIAVCTPAFHVDQVHREAE